MTVHDRNSLMLSTYTGMGSLCIELSGRALTQQVCALSSVPSRGEKKEERSLYGAVYSVPGLPFLSLN